MMRASARSIAPWGFKAIIVHPGGRTQVLARRANGKGKNFKTRAEAVEYAENRIVALTEFRAEQEARRTARWTA